MSRETNVQAWLEAALNPHYFLSRYPGVGVEYDLAAAQELVERMERIWQWLTRTVNLAGE